MDAEVIDKIRIHQKQCQALSVVIRSLFEYVSSWNAYQKAIKKQFEILEKTTHFYALLFEENAQIYFCNLIVAEQITAVVVLPWKPEMRPL